MERRKNKICVICGKDLTGTRRIKTCDNKECQKLYEKQKYEKIKTKYCKDCGKEFNGFGKQCFCSDCKEKRLKHKNYKKVKQYVLCSGCGKELKIQYKNYIRKINDVIYKLCDECKLKKYDNWRKESSIRMKEYNPMFNGEISNKVGNTLRNNYEKKCLENGIIPNAKIIKNKNKIPETLEECKIRMKNNNPMFNEENKIKVRNTIKRKIESGEIQYKRGIEHYLYKGNRKFGRHIRLNLTKWIRIQLSNSNYTCQLCGKTKTELHVHHNEPFREILKKFLEKYNTNAIDIMDEKNIDLLNTITDEIIKYHFNNENIGIVVCPECHSIIDNYYHRLTHYKHHKNEN